ncbi:hypothetical protein D770_05200 [Flammeovirgaceae bacterium 311]|nr:hypothetical protein D770_05200 [Flammeovirgaceae bacterium 311]
MLNNLIHKPQSKISIKMKRFRKSKFIVLADKATKENRYYIAAASKYKREKIHWFYDGSDNGYHDISGWYDCECHNPYGSYESMCYNGRDCFEYNYYPKGLLSCNYVKGTHNYIRVVWDAEDAMGEGSDLYKVGMIKETDITKDYLKYLRGEQPLAYEFEVSSNSSDSWFCASCKPLSNEEIKCRRNLSNHTDDDGDDLPF